MSALNTITRQAYMARKHPDYTPGMREDAIHADVALLALLAAAEIGAAELIRAGKGDAGRALLAACSHFRDVPADTTGVLRGNADLVPAQHAYLTPQPGGRL